MLKKSSLFFYIIAFSFVINNSYSVELKESHNLIEASKNMDLAKTRYYIKNGANVNLKDSNGNTALSYAIANQDFQLMNLLLNNGANPNIMDSTKAPIYCSAKMSEDDRIRLFFNAYNINKCSNLVKLTGSSSSSGFFSGGLNSGIGWTIGGLSSIGLIAVVAGGGGGGSGGSITPTPSVDNNYNLVGEVQGLNTILTNSQYTASVEDTSVTPSVFYSNVKTFDEIRLGYSLARNYTGKYYALNQQTPYYITPASQLTSVADQTKIKVAVFDSGVLTNHVDFINGDGTSNITADLTGTNLAYEYCTANPTATGCVLNTYIQDDPNPSFDLTTDPKASHGTQVAGIIAASYSNNTGITGIAPESEIVPYRLSLNNGEFVPYEYIGNAFEAASANGAVVINNSYNIKSETDSNAGKIVRQQELVSALSDSANTSTSTFIDGMINSVNNNDTIFVFAAGNDGQTESGLISAIPLHFDEFFSNGQYTNFINVVSYDATADTISSFSNHCGVTKNYCLTAPGSNILTTTSTNISTDLDSYAVTDGTSLSAPIVSASVAVLKGAFPYLTSDEITKILFTTARDLGDPGVDDIYGHGMIDLERATRPVGATLVAVDPSLTSVSQTSESSKIKLNSLIANAIKKENLNLVVLDSFNRTFDVPLNSFIETGKDGVDTIDVLNNFANNSKSISLNKDGNFNLYFSSLDSLEDSNKNAEIEFSYSVNENNLDDYGFNLYYGNNPYNAFINDKVDFYNNFSLSNAYGYNALNPYFKSDSQNNFAFNNSVKLNDKTTLNIGAIHQEYTMTYEKSNQLEDEVENLGSSISFLTGLSYNVLDNMTTKVELGFINEYNTLFGTEWSGAFGIGGNNLTYTASMQNNINLFNDKVSLIGQLNFGYTDVSSSNNSLIKDISSLYTNSYALGFNYNFDSELENEKSNISFLISQPVSINSGNLNLSLPIARDDAGNMYYSNHNIDLEDEKETIYQLTYNKSMQDGSSFNFGLIYRDYTENEVVGLLKYSKNF